MKSLKKENYLEDAGLGGNRPLRKSKYEDKRTTDT